MQLIDSSIFIGLKRLRIELYKAQFLMTKSARIIYGTPLMEAVGDCIKYFCIAFSFTGDNARKLDYLDLCIGSYAVLRADLEFVVLENIIHYPRLKPAKDKDGKPIPTPSEDLVSPQKVALFKLVAQIDADMCRWRASLAKGKTVCA